jgi:perosamine synthetase
MSKVINLFDCRLGSEYATLIEGVLQTGQLATGPQVGFLEQSLQKYLKDRHVVGMGDMTNAMILALKLSGVGAGDEVLVLSYNCLSSTSALSQIGAKPIWIEIEPNTANMSLADCEAKITSRTKALILYHVAGYPANAKLFKEFCKKNNIKLIEDANNALGAFWQSEPIGSEGDFSVYSFYANRQVNGIEGAALVCPSLEVALHAKRLRRFGIDASCFRDKYGEIDPKIDVPQISLSSQMNSVAAALANANLKSLDERIEKNRNNVQYYIESLSNSYPSIYPIGFHSESNPSFWVWLVACENRDELMIGLKQNGIECSKLHQPNHIYSGFNVAKSVLPKTDEFMKSILAVPCGWWLTEKNREEIANSLKKFA